MEDKIVTLNLLSENILSLLGVDKIELLEGNMIVYKNEIYKYKNKYYKCIKSGIQSFPTEEHFKEINKTNNENNENYIKLNKSEKNPNSNNRNIFFETENWKEMIVLTKYYEEYKILKFNKNEIEFLGLFSLEMIVKPIQIYTTDTSGGYAAEADIIFYETTTQIKLDGALDNKNFDVQIWIR